MNLSMYFNHCIFSLWLFVQLSLFHKCISLPFPQLLCHDFGSFLGTAPANMECCFDDHRCPVAVDKSLFYKNVLPYSRSKRSLLWSVANSASFTKYPKTSSSELNLCETRSTLLQPLYGTRALTDEKVQILQIPTVFTQNVVIYTCITKETKIIRGECAQQYKAEELYTVSVVLNDASENNVIIQREFLWVEAGCRATFDLTPFSYMLSQKTKSNPVKPASTIKILPSIKRQSTVAVPQPLQEFIRSWPEINEHNSDSLELKHETLNPKSAGNDQSIDSIPNTMENKSYLVYPNGSSPPITNKLVNSKSLTKPKPNILEQKSEDTISDFISNLRQQITNVEFSPRLNENDEIGEEFSGEKESTSKFTKNDSTNYSTQTKIGLDNSQVKQLKQHFTQGKPISNGPAKQPIRNSENEDNQRFDNYEKSDSKYYTNQIFSRSNISIQNPNLTPTRNENSFYRNNKHLPDISNKIGLPLFIHSFEFDPVKNLLPS